MNTQHFTQHLQGFPRFRGQRTKIFLRGDALQKGTSLRNGWSRVRWTKEDRTTHDSTSHDKKLHKHGKSGDATSVVAFSERFVIGEVLGKGSFGTVYRATDTVTGDAVAIKEISGTKSSREAKNEAHHLRSLQGVSGVVKLYGFYDDCDRKKDVKTKTSYIIMQLCDGGDLENFSEENGPLSEEQVRAVAAEVLAMIQGCHHHGILHLDVKAANLLIASPASRELLKTNPRMLNPGWLVASDFGTARVAGLGYSSEFLGTPTHCAPEVFGRKYSNPADVWSTGTMLFRLHSRRMPFWEPAQEGRMKTTSDILRHILSGTPGFGAEVDPLFQDFLQGLLHKDPAQRLTPSQALNHTWLATTE